MWRARFIDWRAAALVAPAALLTATAIAQPAMDMTGQSIPYRKDVVIKVGRSVVIHGERGACGQQPPSWASTMANLPALAIGTWSDGGVGYRDSRACGAPTPARAVIFTATRPGEERFLLFEDPVSIRVEK